MAKRPARKSVRAAKPKHVYYDPSAASRSVSASDTVVGSPKGAGAPPPLSPPSLSVSANLSVTVSKPFLLLTDAELSMWIDAQPEEWRRVVESHARVSGYTLGAYVRRTATCPCTCGFSGSPREWHKPNEKEGAHEPAPGWVWDADAEPPRWCYRPPPGLDVTEVDDSLPF